MIPQIVIYNFELAIIINPVTIHFANDVVRFVGKIIPFPFLPNGLLSIQAEGLSVSISVALTKVTLMMQVSAKLMCAIALVSPQEALCVFHDFHKRIPDGDNFIPNANYFKIYTCVREIPA